MPRLVPGVTDMRFPPVYGPQISLMFAPFARLPYGASLAVWLFASLAACLTCGYLVWKACPRLADRSWTIALLLVADPALHFVLGFAQISAIGLVCVTGGFFALRANRPVLAGLAIGSLFYKPQLGLAAGFIFLFAGEWRIVLGAAMGVVVQIAAACVFWGRSIVADYVRSLVRWLPQVPANFEASKAHMHSWRAFFDLLGLPSSVALGAYLVAAAITLTIALRCWRGRGPLAVRYSVLLIATVLVDPHMYWSDLIVLVPAYLLLWNWALEQGGRRVGDVLPGLPFSWLRMHRFGAAFEWLLYFCYLSPLFGILAEADRIQLSVLGFSALGLVLANSLFLCDLSSLAENTIRP